MSLPGPDISALEYVFPSHHHKDAISSLLIGLQKEGENFCVGPVREKWVKNKAHTSVLAHSTSQLAVCPPCTQFLIPPGDQHTVSASGDIFCLFLCAGNCPVLGTTHPQQQDASLHLSTSASMQTEEDLPWLLSPRLSPADGLLPWHGTVISFFLWPQWSAAFGTAGLGGKKRRGTGLDLHTHYVGETCSQTVPGRALPCHGSRGIAWQAGKDMFGGQRTAPHGIAKDKGSGPWSQCWPNYLLAAETESDTASLFTSIK